MSNKPEIVFTLPATMGGVASFNRNLINHSKLIGNFYSRVILLLAAENKLPIFTEKFNADEVIDFHYSAKENQYSVMKRLNKVLGIGEGVIITDNILTINAVSIFKNPKTLFHLIHDYFYVNQNVETGDAADVAVAHSSFFSDAVFAANPASFGGRSFYIPYGVQQIGSRPVKNNPVLKLVFLGRLSESKGVMRLFGINSLLAEKNIRVNWTVIGKGPLQASLKEQWKNSANIKFCSPETTAEIYEILGTQDIFIFPTIFEGTPVSILECLANAVVTITNDLPGGIRDIVKEGIGYRCRINNMEEYAERIAGLNADRNLLKKMQQNCFDLCKSEYDIDNNADDYFKLFAEHKKLKRKTSVYRVKLSRLDKSSFPNALVKFLRSIR